MKRWKVAGINFDHMHMPGLLKQAQEHPAVDLAGISDENAERMQATVAQLAIPVERVFTDYRQCLETTRPDFVILCPATATHGEWTKRVAAYDVHVLIEKPFAATLAEADQMVADVTAAGKTLAINWPTRWSAVHMTAKRLMDEGAIGEPVEVHYYGGNRGPLYQTMEVGAIDARAKSASWFYQKDAGGGSLMDYLGYGVTFASWFLRGQKPIEVTCVVDSPQGLEVDEHSITVALYSRGLSQFETCWGTWTDPWTHQPQPKCGYVVKGTAGTISSYDYELTVRLQTTEHPEGQAIPVDTMQSPFRNPIEYLVDCLERGVPVSGPISPVISRIGQQLVDSAMLSARLKKTVALVK